VTLRPTAEQQAIADACHDGGHVVAEAGAGTGKTTTARLAATGMAGKGLYAAFNKAIAQEAAATFPAHIDCRTVHSLAYQAVGKRYRGRLNGPRQPAREVARLLRINNPIPLGGGALLQPTQIARMAVETVARFCRTMDSQINWMHAPSLQLLDNDSLDRAVRQQVAPLAQKIWGDLQLDDSNGGGLFRYVHDHYLKQWADQRPTLPYDFVILDEAQDADPLIAGLVMGQRDRAQIIGIGDANQAIYGWRGAVDALRNWPTQTRLYLTESWRFGPAIADEANKWLTLLGASLRLVGNGGPSRLDTIPSPDAVLCRTNATAMREAITALAANKRVALVGGGDQIRRLAEAANELKSGRGTTHPELCVFRTWREVQDYASDEQEGSDLRTAVKLIDDHGADEVIAAVARLVPDRPSNGRGRHVTPDIIVSTAHKAKGLDWGTVRVADDFVDPGTDDSGRPRPVSRPDAMLAYVTVTRAKTVLDRGGLAYIDNRPEVKVTQ
jgi:hypothetical protein